MHLLDAIAFIGVPSFAAGAALALWGPGAKQAQPQVDLRAYYGEIEVLREDVQHLMGDYGVVLAQAGEEVPEAMRPHVAALMNWDGSGIAFPPNAADAKGVEFQVIVRMLEGLRRALADMTSARTDQSSSGALAQTVCASRLMRSTREHFEGRTIELVHHMRIEPQMFEPDQSLALQGAA